MTENIVDPDQTSYSEASYSGSRVLSKREISGFSRTRVQVGEVFMLLLVNLICSLVGICLCIRKCLDILFTPH